jgi:hypothetical protein
MMEKFVPALALHKGYGLTIHHEWSISMRKLTHKLVVMMKKNQSASVPILLLRHNSVSESPSEVCKHMHDHCLQGSACFIYSCGILLEPL